MPQAPSTSKRYSPPCRVLHGADRNLMIVGANEAYFAITGFRRDQLEGRFVFDVFPDNPNDPQATAVADSSASYGRVLELKRSDVMAVQRHDVLRSQQIDGGGHQDHFEETPLAAGQRSRPRQAWARSGGFSIAWRT